MYVEKNLEGKKNASSDVITSSLCLSRDTDLVTWYAFNNGGIVFSTEVFTEEDDHLLLNTLFNWQEEIQQTRLLA